MRQKKRLRLSDMHEKARAWRASVFLAELGQHDPLAQHETKGAQQLFGATDSLAILVHHADLGLNDFSPTAAMTANHLGGPWHFAHALHRSLFRGIRSGRAFDYVEFRLISHKAIIAQL